MSSVGTRKKDFLSLADLDAKELALLLRTAREMKSGVLAPSLPGASLAILLEKPSLRTRVSFEVAMRQLGGTAISLRQEEVGLGTREPVADVARVLSRYVDAIAARVHDHRTLEELAAHASVPVINALSDREHPCQALADLLTASERWGRLEGLTIAFVGDGNNVAASLALGCALAGCRFRIASPPGYDLPAEVSATGRRIAGSALWSVERHRDPREAVRGADAVYTDVWISMGQEAEAEERREAFQGYQVTPELLALAAPGAVFLHDLPAHSGEEISPGMLEHPQSAVFDQAENRLYVQKALLVHLLGSARTG